jgi:hypothetical protein
MKEGEGCNGRRSGNVFTTDEGGGYVTTNKRGRDVAKDEGEGMLPRIAFSIP